MRQEIEVMRAVYIADYQVTHDAAIDIMDNIGDGICPICKEENQPVDTPAIGQTAAFSCDSCGVDIIIEVWEV
jgi:hypothetical protein